jgi:hypothetical protein
MERPSENNHESNEQKLTKIGGMRFLGRSQGWYFGGPLALTRVLGLNVVEPLSL